MAVTILLGEAITFAHKAVGEFAEHHIDMVSCVHRKCQTQAGVSGEVKGTAPAVNKFVYYTFLCNYA